MFLTFSSRASFDNKSILMYASFKSIIRIILPIHTRDIFSNNTEQLFTQV